MGNTSKKTSKSGTSSLNGPNHFVFVFLLFLFYWAFNYLDNNGGAFNASVYSPHRNISEVNNLKVVKSPDELAYERGEGIYARCAACHQANGKGIPPVFPALEGSEVALNDSEKHIEILMEGIQGSAMAAFGDSYSEVDIASVITYTRQAWSNGENGDGVIVTPKDIVEYKKRINL